MLAYPTTKALMTLVKENKWLIQKNNW
jgi:hypothetical protein